MKRAWILAVLFALPATQTARADESLRLRLLRPLLLAPADEPPPRERLAVVRPVAAVQPKKDDDAPIYKQWWFWALTAAVVGGTVALGVAVIEPQGSRPRPCAPGLLTCFGDGR